MLRLSNIPSMQNWVLLILHCKKRDKKRVSFYEYWINFEIIKFSMILFQIDSVQMHFGLLYDSAK